MQKIGTCAFGRCSNLAEVEFLGDRNAIDMNLPHVFKNTPYLESLEFSLFIENGNYLSGFTGVCPETVNIPDGVSYIANTFDGCGKLWANWYKSLASGATDAAGAADMSEIALTVTNVVVHYVTQSVPTDAVVPSTSSGIVNIIGEVTAGAPVAIPSAWAERYSGFVARFGSDFTAALTKPTGKRDGAGNAMLVWQDFVAGTDPTDDDDVFKASITFDEDGRPVISWTPEFADPSEAAKRRYRKYGKVRIQDKDWTEFSDGEESNFNFFKVTVEMR